MGIAKSRMPFAVPIQMVEAVALSMQQSWDKGVVWGVFPHQQESTNKQPNQEIFRISGGLSCKQIQCVTGNDHANQNIFEDCWHIDT